MHKKILILILLALIPLSCAIPAGINMFSSVPATEVAQLASDVGPLLVQAPIDATPTATPFQPLPPTPTYIPTDFPTPIPTIVPTASTQAVERKTWANYPGPTIWPDIQIPDPVGLLPQPSDQVNIMVLGSDLRPHDYGFRTDTILLFTISPSLGTVNITSFPRDLYVYIPGWTIQRINTAFAHSDFDLLATTMEYNFGVHPDYYVLATFWAFSEAIDNLGGINVDVARIFTDARTGRGDFTVYPGINHMNGDEALWYVRARYTSSDFDRGRRQQEVIQAIFNRVMSLNGIAKAPQLYQTYKNSVTTNISFDLITTLLPLAPKLTDASLIHHYYIGPGQVYSWTNTSGADVLVPNRDAVLEVMRQALNIK
jgi:LCP family protein required for cell wall assembly